MEGLDIFGKEQDVTGNMKLDVEFSRYIVRHVDCLIPHRYRSEESCSHILKGITGVFLHHCTANTSEPSFHSLGLKNITVSS